jgi:hypothetical protein
MSLSDLHPIAQLRRRQSHLFENVSPARRPRKIVIYSMDAWQLGIFEQFLHLAFLRKGHRPVTIHYDGVLPLTAWENASVARPPLKTIADRFDFINGCFGLASRGISQYLDGQAAMKHAEHLVSKTTDGDLSKLSYRGIAVGRIARRDLFQYTLGAFDPQSAEEFDLYRSHLIHAIMSVDLARSILDREKPDTVILVNGKSVMYTYMYEVARAAGIHVVTWEEGMFFDTSVRLAHDDRAIDFPVEPADWSEYRKQSNTVEQDHAIDTYFCRWRDQTATSHVYYSDEIRDFGRICEALAIPSGTRIVSMFCNIIWDTNALDKDDAFEGMMDWIFCTIEALAKSDCTLIVRAHPGEAKCEFKTRTPVRDYIQSRFGCIPDHVRIVDGLSELSSYEIAMHSDRCAVYTSTLGIELTLAGLQPLICGVPFYARKGFTNDIVSRAQYTDLLLGRETPDRADPDLLRRFMHLVLFRLIKRPEFFVGIHKSPQQPRIAIDSFDGFPESMPNFNEIVDCILNRRSFTAPVPEPQVCLA